MLLRHGSSPYSTVIGDFASVTELKSRKRNIRKGVSRELNYYVRVQLHLTMWGGARQSVFNPDYYPYAHVYTLIFVTLTCYNPYSRAIARYVANKYAPDSTLYPKDPQRRALVDRALDRDLGTIFHCYIIVSKNATDLG